MDYKLKKINKYNWNDKDKFLSDLRLSSSMSEFLKNHGMTASSGNFKTFKKWSVIHNININNFITRKVTVNITLKEKKVINSSDFLIKSHLVGVKEVKKLLKKEQLIEYCCAGCKNTGEWNGTSLKLQLEHKNGDNTDNRLENLEYLCPNCHSQTSTYGSKNTHNKLFKIRINDLLKLQVINEEKIQHLMEEWNASYFAVKHWIHKYADKITKAGVNILINKNMHENNPQYIKAVEELKKTNCTLEDISNISIKFNVQSQALRKILKNKDIGVFNQLPESISTTNIKKADVNRAKRLEYIKNINLKKFNINEMLKLFDGNYAYMLVWLNKNDIEIYKEVLKQQKDSCPDCQSLNIKKKGTITNNNIVLQKYECKDCNKCFRGIKV